MQELYNARVWYDKQSCSLKVYKHVKGVGDIQVLVFKLDAQCQSFIGRAFQAANTGHEPDAFMLAFGMGDERAFQASTWGPQPHSRELKEK